MGLDLAILPYDADSTIQFSHTVLNCEPRRELFDAILEIEKSNGVAVADGFMSYVSRDDAHEDTHYGETVETPYGERLKYVHAKNLKGVASHEGVTDNYPNRAIWAYLSHLDGDTKVALFWH